jgi:predicted patatin/cPLA2 family phospholipase
MDKKFAIIIAGGGMRSSYSAGVISALAKEYGVTEPFLLICGSGSIGTGAYYVAKQYEAIKNIWTNYAVSKRLLNKRRFWKMMDIDYLVNDIFKKKEPLDEEAVYSSKTKYLMALLNKDTGDVAYLENKNDGVSFFKKMEAALEMPIAYKINPGVKIGGTNYCDSIFSANSYVHLKKAVELGAEKILMIRNVNPDEGRFGDFIYRVWMLFQKFRKKYYKNEKKLLEYRLPDNVELFKFCPRKMIKLITLDEDGNLLKQAFEQGYRETVTDNDLKKFLKEK